MNKVMPSTPQVELNRIIRDNRVDEYPSRNLALGMRPLEFGPGTSGWLWGGSPAEHHQSVRNNARRLSRGVHRRDLSTAIGSVLEEGEWAVTAELKLSYLRAAPPRRLTGRGRVIRRTRAIAFMDAEIRDADGALAVAASSTWAISRFKT